MAKFSLSSREQTHGAYVLSDEGVVALIEQLASALLAVPWRQPEMLGSLFGTGLG